MREVAIIGVGLSKWGELWNWSLRDIFVEAAVQAIKDAGVDKINSMYVGCMSSGLFTEQEHIGALLADYLGVSPIPATRVESACASGGVALRQAFVEVASGLSDIVLAGGVEKMTDVSGDYCTHALAAAADADYEAYNGATFPALYALIARRHMHDFGTTRRQLSLVAVKNHKNGLLNPNAQYQQEISTDDVENSSLVADPLRLLDCSGITDGAACVIVCSLDIAQKISRKPVVKISGSGHATDTIALHDRKDLTSFSSVTKAAEIAYKMAKKSPRDIQLAEVHDCFTIAEICVTEALGFFERGQGGKAVESGATTLDGKIPINTSGGLKAKGHPVGATGIAQVIEVVEQLRGNAGRRQLNNVRVGMTQNMGGTGASCVVHILERV